mmetsp:Transcript_40126/g.99466  ORF Transcript_40126/g.99466 Transcript_40126/m.99466 type:complete len:114 (+) Transcript_40126:91-432(+)
MRVFMRVQNAVRLMNATYRTVGMHSLPSNDPVLPVFCPHQCALLGIHARNYWQKAMLQDKLIELFCRVARCLLTNSLSIGYLIGAQQSVRSLLSRFIDVWAVKKHLDAEQHLS